MRHLALLAGRAGLKQLIAEVLPENSAMLEIFRKFGFQPSSRRASDVVHLSLTLS
jgi:RimJ/RimL family protein N-acetyltransferase